MAWSQRFTAMARESDLVNLVLPHGLWGVAGRAFIGFFFDWFWLMSGGGWVGGCRPGGGGWLAGVVLVGGG